MAIPISGAIITYNERAVVRRTLECLQRLCEEIVAVDSYSTDGTQDVLKEYDATVLQRGFDNHRDQKNFAIENCGWKWILLLDSDEYLNNKLCDNLQDMLKKAEADGIDAIGVPRANYLNGDGPRGWPDIQTRIFRSYVRHAGHPFHHSTTAGAKHPIIINNAGVIVHEKTQERQERQNRLYYYLRPGDYTTKPDGAEDLNPPPENYQDRLNVNAYQEYLQRENKVAQTVKTIQDTVKSVAEGWL